MSAPQPFQYQGSKRALAATILQYLPAKMTRLVEPFAGSAAISTACAVGGRAKEFWLNDCNKPLAELVALLINHPEDACDAYRQIWRDADADPLEQYYSIREQFNRTQDPKLLLYLLARCVKGSVRYNADGLFNQSPDKRRLGTLPTRMRQNLLEFSHLLRGKTIVTSSDYGDVLGTVRNGDVVYMDPPYQGVCGVPDSRYFAGIIFDDFVTALDGLNRRGVRYLISYDGRLGDRSYGIPLPAYLNLTLVEIEAGRSSQATLLGRNEITFESLYLSANLAKDLGVTAGAVRQTK